MTGQITENWRLIAQSLSALADHVNNAVGYQLTPVTFANLPPTPAAGMLACISDGTTNTVGSIPAGGGTHIVMVWYNGTAWTVAGI